MGYCEEMGKWANGKNVGIEEDNFRELSEAKDVQFGKDSVKIETTYWTGLYAYERRR